MKLIKFKEFYVHFAAIYYNSASLKFYLKKPHNFK